MPPEFVLVPAIPVQKILQVLAPLLAANWCSDIAIARSTGDPQA